MVAIVALLVVVIFLLIRRGPRQANPPAPVTTTVLEREAGSVDLSDIFGSIGISDTQRDQPLVIPQDADGTALVVGEKSVAQSWGTVLAEAGPRIEASVRRSSASVQAGIAGAERAGYLVKLHRTASRR